MQAAVLAAFFQELREARLIDGTATVVEPFDLRFIVIHAPDDVACFGEAGGRNKADVSRPDDRNFHENILIKDVGTVCDAL
jgi:hypothetical protein